MITFLTTDRYFLPSISLFNSNDLEMYSDINLFTTPKKIYIYIAYV